MEVVAIIDCSGCCTHREVTLKEGENKVQGCPCGYHGDEGGTVIVNIDRSY